MCSDDWVSEKKVAKGYLCEECAEKDEKVTLELHYTASVFISVPRLVAAKLQRADAEGKGYDNGGFYTKWGTVYYKEDGKSCEIQGEECDGWTKHADSKEWHEEVALNAEAFTDDEDDESSRSGDTASEAE